VSPDDVQEIYADVLRHRILLSYEAEADGWTTDQILQKLLQHVPVP
jgi:MoxR-like ATPase